MVRTSNDTAACPGLCRASRTCAARAAVALAFVCALSSPASLAATVPPRLQPGLRNNDGSHRLNPRQLQAVLDGLREKTGFLEMRFDESDALVLGDRRRTAGGSATARGLLVAALESGKMIELESHDHSPHIAFARNSDGPVYTPHGDGARVEVQSLQLDFADFAQPRGDREALAAFDLGFALLHELAHGVLGLSDVVSDAERLGACEGHVNLMRRELELPERQHYRARVSLIITPGKGVSAPRAELLFASASRKADRVTARRFSVRWDAENVSFAGAMAMN